MDAGHLNSMDISIRAQSAALQGFENQARGISKKAPGEADSVAASQKDAQLKKVAKDFESIFINQLFQTMRKASPKGGLLGNSRESEIFTSMQDEEVAKCLAQGSGIGLSDMIYKELKKTS